MTSRERFLMLLCSYLGLLNPGRDPWQYEQVLTKARALDLIFDDPETSAWEYARWAAGYTKRPDWVDPR
jgi:hypothetical protein